MSCTGKPSQRRRPLRALWRAAEGIAVVEFAFVAGFLVLLYLGSVQLSDAIFANRKVTTTARAITDLTTQFSVLTENDVQGILLASGKALTPYSASNARIRISQIAVDEAGVGRVSWSRIRGEDISQLDQCAVVDVPEELAIPNSFLIYGEVNFTYVPMFAAYTPGTLELADDIFMLPRVSNSVSLLTSGSEGQDMDCSDNET
ncbi:MAG TPA: TadE/TadG family type IV pilus assembly protein [Croceibacterium sp.]|nr:TadE/TadG family type IV pilus assembly protein [Croceibacterium sp.]